MYTVDFIVGGTAIESYSPQTSDDLEQVWMSAGFDLLNHQGLTAESLAIDLLYVSQALKGSPDYFRETWGGDKYNATLRALDDLHELCDSYPMATIDVRY